MANLKTNAGRPKLFSIDVEVEQSPEEKLWKAVLYQGVFESLTFRHNALPLTDTEKKERLSWLKLDNPDFLEVCENAGYSARYVYKQIRKVLKNNELETKIQINPMVKKTILSGTESNT
jgi:hypothetical protein